MTITVLPTPAADSRPLGTLHRPIGFAPLRGVIVKEFLENFKYLIFILLALVLCVGGIIWTDSGGFTKAIHQDSALLDGGFLALSCFACPAAAFLFALAQIFSQRSPDLGAFFLHRAITPTRMFLAKILSGFLLYFLALGVPILILTCISAVSKDAGYVFDIHLVRPYVADFFAGLAYYFAGILAAQRQAQLYASRLFPILAAIVLSMVSYVMPGFWQAMALILVVNVFFGLAAWNCYIHNGLDQALGQPRFEKTPPRRFSLIARLAFSAIMVVAVSTFPGSVFFFAGSALESYIRELPRDIPVPKTTWSYYSLLPDGEPACVSYDVESLPADVRYMKPRVERYFDLAGNPLPAAATQVAANEHAVYQGEYITASHLPSSYRDYADALQLSLQETMIADPDAPFYNQRWYYLPFQRYFVGYSIVTHQCVGTFGVTGLLPPQSRPQPFPKDPFLPTYVTLDHVVYLNQFLGSGPARTPYLTLNPDENLEQFDTLWIEGTSPQTSRWNVAVTDKNIHLFLVEDYLRTRPLFNVPLEHSLDRYALRVSYHPKAHRVVFWYFPDSYLDTPQAVVTYDEQGKLLSRVELPILPKEMFETLEPHSTAMPGYLFALGVFDSFDNPFLARALQRGYVALTDLRVTGTPYNTLRDERLYSYTSVAPYYYTGIILCSLLSAAIVFFATRRHRFTLLGNILWPLATLLLGPVGLITFFFTQPLPKRIACSSCHHKRLVTRNLCEHCRAPFPPPPTNGTEILAPTEVPA